MINKLIDKFFLPVEAIFSGFLTLVAYLFGVEYAAIMPTLIILVGADHLTGVAKSIRKKIPITSFGLKRLFSKLAYYAGALVGVYHLGELVQGELKETILSVSSYLPIYIGMIELKSIVENCAEAGFKIPGIDKLNNLLSLKK